jgi:SOS response regulatory protein OraA/RecX
MSEDFYEEEFISEEEQDDIIENEEGDTVMEDKKGEEYIYDQVKGGHGKKHILSDLNKKRLGNHEMDEMFCDWF